jgi:GNAT superfamily N-acetyltransferase
VLRDGSVATVRRTRAGDHETMRRFFHELSQESRRLRFFTAGEPADALVDRLCDSADERRNVTLVAVRQAGEATSFIAVGSYFATGEHAAEAAFAVDDRFHGKGLATELLERLAAIAAHHGFRRFDATTLAALFRAGELTAILSVGLASRLRCSDQPGPQQKLAASHVHVRFLSIRLCIAPRFIGGSRHGTSIQIFHTATAPMTGSGRDRYSTETLFFGPPQHRRRHILAAVSAAGELNAAED